MSEVPLYTTLRFNMLPDVCRESARHSDREMCDGSRRIQEQLFYRNVQRFRGGLVFQAHGLLYHSTLGLRVMKEKRLQMCGRWATYLCLN